MNLTYIPLLTIFSCISMFITVLHNSSVAQPNEVFRLAPGLRYNYYYGAQSGASIFGSPRYHHSDSGSVSCTILDSVSIDDTTRSWLVSQSSYLVHRQWTPGFDSTYSTWDSSTTTLTELTTGYHELQCSTAVWMFPEIHSSNQTTRVFRYADTTDVLIAQRLWSCDWVAIPSCDSIWLSADSGFSHRELFHCYGDQDNNSYDSRSISLRSLTIVSVAVDDPFPQIVELLSPYPNPFNSSTTIQFRSFGQRHVVVRVIDILGREIERIFDGIPKPGNTMISWNSDGNSSGVYLVTMEGDGYRFVRKLILLR